MGKKMLLLQWYVIGKRGKMKVAEDNLIPTKSVYVIVHLIEYVIYLYKYNIYLYFIRNVEENTKP